MPLFATSNSILRLLFAIKQVYNSSNPSHLTGVPMKNLLDRFRCLTCGGFASGEDYCEFCGSRLHPRAFLLNSVVCSLLTLLTYMFVVFVPRRVGTFLENHKKGALAGPVQVLIPAATLFYVAQVIRLGYVGAMQVYGLDVETWQGKLVFYVTFYSLAFTHALFFHGFVRAFGSKENFLSTLTGICYTTATWFLATAFFLFLQIGPTYQMLSVYEPSGRIPPWHWFVTATSYVWLWIVSLVTIQSKIHRLLWYKVAASAILASLGFSAWYIHFLWDQYLKYVR